MDTIRIGTIDYEVAANFIPANSNSLKMRRAAAARPHRIAQSGTQVDVRSANNVLPLMQVGKYKWGDVNLDGNVDSGDIMAIYLAMAGNADAELKVRADVNRDNSIDSGDVMAVYSIMAGN